MVQRSCGMDFLAEIFCLDFLASQSVAENSKAEKSLNCLYDMTPKAGN